MQWNAKLLEQFISPTIGQPVTFKIPELEVQNPGSGLLIQEYFLNSVLVSGYPEAIRRYVESIIARTQMLAIFYTDARASTLEYQAKWEIGQPGVGRYLRAISHWETVFLNIQIIHDALAKLIGYQPDPNEAAIRIRRVGNRIKHVAEDIDNNQLTTSGLPIWLHSTGFQCIYTTITVEELCCHVNYLIDLATILTNPTDAASRLGQFMTKHGDTAPFDA